MSMSAGAHTWQTRETASAAIEILAGDTVVMRLSPSREVGTAAERSPDPRVLYRFAEGELVGRIEVLRPFADFRGTEVQAGTWEVEYRIQPPLKEHVDTTEYRDFLVLRRDLKEREHPTVLALVPSAGEVGEPPGLRQAGGFVILDFDLGKERIGLVIASPPG
jgi:hypothetical protein